MKLTELNDLFKSKIDIDQFKRKIDVEVAEYKKRITKSGRSSSIYLEEDIRDFKINNEDLIVLCSLFLENRIDKWELNYIAEALVFTSYDKMINSKIQFALDSLTDPEYERLINDNFVKKIMQDLI